MGYAALGQVKPELKELVRGNFSDCLDALWVDKSRMEGIRDAASAEKQTSMNSSVDGSKWYSLVLEEIPSWENFYCSGNKFLDTLGIAQRLAARGGGAKGGRALEEGLRPLLIQKWTENFDTSHSMVAEKEEEEFRVSRRTQRDIAASAQAVMEEDIVALVEELLRMYDTDDENEDANEGYSSENRSLDQQQQEQQRSARNRKIDGIVLTGGCALNVRVNSVVAQRFPHLPVHVPAAASDCGLAVGSAWLVRPPLPLGGPPVQLQYQGPRLFDVTYEGLDHNYDIDQPLLPLLGDRALALGARRLDFSSTTTDWSRAHPSMNFSRFSPGMAVLVRLLADDQVIGVVRGRAEHGPRALVSSISERFLSFFLFQVFTAFYLTNNSQYLAGSPLPSCTPVVGHEGAHECPQISGVVPAYRSCGAGGARGRPHLSPRQPLPPPSFALHVLRAATKARGSRCPPRDNALRWHGAAADGK